MYIRDQSIAHRIIDALDVIAMDYDSHEFGLPISVPGVMDKMVSAVNEILTTPLPQPLRLPLSTKCLIQYIKDNQGKMITAVIHQGQIKATHFCVGLSDTEMQHEGIDGEGEDITYEQFTEFYDKTNWYIESVEELQ